VPRKQPRRADGDRETKQQELAYLTKRFASVADVTAAAQRARDSDRPRVEPVKPTIPAHESADPAVRKFNDRALEELGAVQGYLSKCFEVHRKELPDKLTVLTRVLIDTDPDVGAVLTADQLTDPDGKPLPAAFDDCIRNMLQTFALPPLPPTQDSQFLLALQLSFRDDD